MFIGLQETSFIICTSALFLLFLSSSWLSLVLTLFASLPPWNELLKYGLPWCLSDFGKLHSSFAPARYFYYCHYRRDYHCHQSYRHSCHRGKAINILITMVFYWIMGNFIHHRHQRITITIVIIDVIIIVIIFIGAIATLKNPLTYWLPWYFIELSETSFIIGTIVLLLLLLSSSWLSLSSTLLALLPP